MSFGHLVIGNWQFLIGSWQLVWFGMVQFGWQGGGGMFGNVLEQSRMFWETQKSFMVGGGGIFAITESAQVQTS